LSFGLIVAVSSDQELAGRKNTPPYRVYYPGYVAFLLATALALLLRASIDRVRIESIATVGAVVLLSSATMILLRLILGRAEAQKDT
jgi:cell division protein FtsW (lipid II flippase)